MEINPVLRDGEPGFEIDTGKLKIGDGFLPWLALEYINSDTITGQEEIIKVNNYAELPKTGNSDKLYRIIEEKALYQWDEISLTYEKLGGTAIEEITIIDCGSATKNI